MCLPCDRRIYQSRFRQPNPSSIDVLRKKNGSMISLDIAADALADVAGIAKAHPRLFGDYLVVREWPDTCAGPLPLPLPLALGEVSKPTVYRCAARDDFVVFVPGSETAHIFDSLAGAVVWLRST